MKDIYLHIGAEKTGTTSLQEFFALNGTQLGRNGFHYPCDERRPYVAGRGHLPLAGCFAPECPEYLPPTKHFEAAFVYRALLSDIERTCADKILISAEHFSSRCSDRVIVHSIRNWFKGYPVKVIVYLRRQDELLISSFGTYQRVGGRLSFDECRKLVNEENSYFCHDRMLQPWKEAFGAENLIVRPFEGARFREDGLYRDFLACLGVTYDPSRWTAPHRCNCLISREASEFLQLANERFPEHTPGTRAAWEEGQRFREDLLPRLPQTTPLETLLPSELRDDILESFAACNHAVAKTFLPELNPDALYQSTQLDEPGTAPPECLQKTQLIDTLIEIWREKQACAETIRAQADTIVQLTRQLAAQHEARHRPWYRRILSVLRRLVTEVPYRRWADRVSTTSAPTTGTATGPGRAGPPGNHSGDIGLPRCDQP